MVKNYLKRCKCIYRILISKVIQLKNTIDDCYFRVISIMITIMITVM